LLIALGGPIGVYETDPYPFLAEEIAVFWSAWREVDLRSASVSVVS
jgi:hypothetical protein